MNSLDCLFFFFFSSRRRHTRLQGDWSSDVCSSDLDECYEPAQKLPRLLLARRAGYRRDCAATPRASTIVPSDRERVVEGKRGDLGGRRIIKKKKKNTIKLRYRSINKEHRT